MNDKFFHHALYFCKETCIACTHCMRVCPTQAIRVRNGKAELLPNRCIDCGECYRVCPVDAVKVEQDDFNLIYNYKHRVVLIPGVFLGQFPEDINQQQIYSVLMELGFTHVCEVETGAEILRSVMADYIDELYLGDVYNTLNIMKKDGRIPRGAELPRDGALKILSKVDTPMGADYADIEEALMEYFKRGVVDD